MVRNAIVRPFAAEFERPLDGGKMLPVALGRRKKPEHRAAKVRSSRDSRKRRAVLMSVHTFPPRPAAFFHSVSVVGWISFKVGWVSGIAFASRTVNSSGNTLPGDRFRSFVCHRRACLVGEAVFFLRLRSVSFFNVLIDSIFVVAGTCRLEQLFDRTAY